MDMNPIVFIVLLNRNMIKKIQIHWGVVLIF